MEELRNLVVGVDIGGTFTDFVLLDRNSGEVFTWKALTTPQDPSKAVIEGLAEFMKHFGLPLSGVEKLVHATTLVTNAVIERKGAKTGLITTRGFRDTLEIGREIRYDLYDLYLKQPEPLVPRQLRQEVQGRVNISGQVQQPLDRSELLSVAKDLIERGVESLALSFLHAYIESGLEKEAEAILKEEFPELYLSVSSDVAGEIGEFERTSTVVANAYVKPLMEKYLTRLESGLQELGSRGSFYIMLSSGGFCNAELARQYPIRLLESGPAAGALAAAYWGKMSGNPKVLGFDMGGTTAKACLIDDGEPEKVYQFEAGRVHRFKRGSGLPILITTVELIEIGAGGGSLAHVDSLGLLKVGPESASSDPGPVCYGLGGLEPTVTDADLVLGYLDPNFFLGGAMTLDRVQAEEAIHRKLAKPMGLDTITAAWGVHTVVNENMARAARIYTAEKGQDHRQYAMVATGGAGPVHAYGVARSLNLKRVIYPFAAGVGSAMGMLVAPAREDLSRSFISSMDECSWDDANHILSELEGIAIERLMAAGVKATNISISRMVDMRYANQGHDVTVPLPYEPLGPESKDRIVEAFGVAYRQLFSNTVQGAKLEFVNLRLIASSMEETPEFHFRAQAKVRQGERRPFLKGHRPIYLPFSEGEERGAGYHSVPVYDRYYLQPGDRLQGPCIIEEKESTIVINGPAEITVNEHLSVVADLKDSVTFQSVSMELGGVSK